MIKYHENIKPVMSSTFSKMEPKVISKTLIHLFLFNFKIEILAYFSH